MISSTISNTLYKTLNYSQQQYKETEEIVENNPGIILLVTKSKSCSADLTSKNHTPAFSNVSINSEHLDPKNERALRASYTNKGFEGVNDTFVSDILRWVCIVYIQKI